MDREPVTCRVFAAELDDIDVLILDEVTSLAVVIAVRAKLGLSGFRDTWCDFSQNDTNQFGSLKLGIINPTAAMLFDIPAPTGNLHGPFSLSPC